MVEKTKKNRIKSTLQTRGYYHIIENGLFVGGYKNCF